MHRLSLGNSPTHGGRAERVAHNRTEEIDGRKESPEVDKKEKVRSGFCRSERIVHIIPVILLLCILVLYLFSSDPIQKGILFLWKTNRIVEKGVQESAMIGDPRLSSSGELLALYSHRSLQQAAKKDNVTATPSTPLLRHRKFADF